MGRGVLKAFYLRSTIKVEKIRYVKHIWDNNWSTKESGLVPSAETFWVPLSEKAPMRICIVFSQSSYIALGYDH